MEEFSIIKVNQVITYIGTNRLKDSDSGTQSNEKIFEGDVGDIFELYRG